LYWAVDKGLFHVTKVLLDASANTEIANKVEFALTETLFFLFLLQIGLTLCRDHFQWQISTNSEARVG